MLGLVAFGQKDTLHLSDERTAGNLPTISLSASELENDQQSQDISGLLQSSRDVFVRTAGYNFGPLRFRMRGYDSENTTVMINGIKVNDMVTGRAYWGSWGGLNDITRYQDVKAGISASEHAFGGVGGVTQIEGRASSLRKGTRLTYSLSNRSYANRVMFTTNTGMMDNGWAFSLSGSRRWGNEGYVKGTFYDAWSYYLAAEKKINNKHSIGIIGFAAPSRRGKQGASTQEAYDLADNNYYNPYWGYQNGEVRNSRESRFNQPMVMMSHYWTMNEKTKLNTSVSYGFGKGGSTALNWDQANDPRPDYYRTLPSYYLNSGDMAGFETATSLWQNNQAFRQVNWDAMYFANSKFLQTVNNVDGIAGNNVAGNRAKYIVENRITDKKQFDFSSVLNTVVNDHLNVTAGIRGSRYQGRSYKEVDDLLGADYYLDVDKFADGTAFAYSDEQQSNLLQPNHLVKEGDRFGYDYTSNINNEELFAQAAFTYSHFDFYLGGELNHTQYWRTGHMKKGLFPENSYGDSEKQDFLDFGAKGGATWKIDGRNYLRVNGMYLTRAPQFRTAFVSPRTRNSIIPDLEQEKIMSGDLSYIYRGTFVKSRLSLYYTEFNDQTWQRSFYHEDLHTFVNYVMQNVNKRHAGMEFGIEANVTPTITVTGVAALGENIYTSRPDVSISRDNDAASLATNRKVYIKNYYAGQSPQTAASLGVKYRSPKYWFVGVDANYIADSYLDVNPDNHTAEAMGGKWEGDGRIDNLLEQEHLNEAFTMNIFAGKSWKISDYYIALSLNISNVLDNTDIVTGGYEQLRTDIMNPDRFQSKYYYLYGRNYFLNLNFRF